MTVRATTIDAVLAAAAAWREAHPDPQPDNVTAEDLALIAAVDAHVAGRKCTYVGLATAELERCWDRAEPDSEHCAYHGALIAAPPAPRRPRPPWQAGESNRL